MKPIIPFALLGALFAVGAASAATTDPVGYVSLGDTTVGQPAIKANTDVFISIPLDRTTVFAGTVASVAGNVITLSGTPALPSLTGTPHTAKIGSGAKSGLVGLVTANDATTITIQPQSSDTLAGVVAGDTVSVNLAWTVGSLMGNTFPAGVQLFTFPASAALNPAAEGVYEWDGTNWIDTVNTGEAADNDVLYPSETLAVRNPTGTPVATFSIVGEVPTANSRVIVGDSGTGTDNAASFVSPVDETIGTSGLSAIAAAGDQVLGYDNASAGINKAASAVLEFDGTDWIDTVNTGEADNAFPLGSGKGFFFRRAVGAAAGDVAWTDQPNYIPNL